MIEALQDAARRVLANSVLDTESGCIVWQGYVAKSGHGLIQATALTGGRKSPRLVHRVVYAALVEDPGDRDVHHVCGTRACVNIDHLTAIDHADHARLHAGPTCPGGHGPEHWRIKNGKWRACRTCENAQKREKRRLQSVRS